MHVRTIFQALQCYVERIGYHDLRHPCSVSVVDTCQDEN